MHDSITDGEWQRFQEQGYLHLAGADPQEVAGLAQRLDEIMLGSADIAYDELLMQLDRSSELDTEPGLQTKGYKGATMGYRKIQHLEIDPLFLSYMQKSIFGDICARAYGATAEIACFRAMFMNKPPGRSSELRWHQDRWVNLTRDPLITVWTALDPATLENGCLRIIPGSHHELVNPSDDSGFLTNQMVEDLDEDVDVMPLEMQAGGVVLLHNHTLHSSGVNQSSRPRRAFSACYMDASTQDRNGAHFATLFGSGRASVPEAAPRPGAVT